MKLGTTTYNERSWAIDLIGHIKIGISKNNRPVKDASGEQTIKAEGGSLFPDVLLFGDRATARILQGWELKMPDTSIYDYEFRENATTKALALGLDSFVLWNVSEAHLYTRKPQSETFSLKKKWGSLSDITTRNAVLANRDRWEALADQIVSYMNDLFDNGTLEGRQFIDAYQSGGITSLIMENSGLVAEALRDAAKRSSVLRAEMILWWDTYQAEYGGEKMETVLAQAVISNWIGKLLFAHILRETDTRAHAVAGITEDTTPKEALELFKKISEDCNFWTIFSASLGLDSIPDQAWNQLKQFNSLLTDLRLGSVDQSQLSRVLEATVEVTVRKVRGQYPTPIELARLLVHLCIRNTVDDKILDPCCGSGTIPRAALEQKLSAGVDPALISASVFSGDQDPQAVQIATFALAKPSMMHIPLRLFQRDAFTLSPDAEIEFKNPSDGKSFLEKLGTFDAIASNLPFVAQEGRKQYGNAIAKVTASFSEDSEKLPRRADIAAYLPFSLHPLLKHDGRLGIIITNAWLGTDWGDAFFKLLGQYYNLKTVITSGAGRWFHNSEVVTNILLMEKKKPDEESGNINFVVLKRPISEIADEETVHLTAAQIELAQTQSDTLHIRSVSPENMKRFRQLGLGGNAQFVNCDWVLNLPLIPVNSLFKIRRGERRGMNALFYPTGKHGIEATYIRPLAKSLSDFKKLKGSAVKEAFCCDKTEAELLQLGHTGALNWIKRFKTTENIKKLSKGNSLWYQMDADEMSELVMSIAYGDRLFVARLNPPAFVDQRLVRLDPIKKVEIDLCHALLNSTIGMFLIEGLGFGRGLGALDLNKDRIEGYMQILDPSKIGAEEKKSIIDSFSHVLGREILCVADELEQDDRRKLDEAIISAFKLDIDLDTLYESLLVLVEIRLTANI
ncbi:MULTISPECIES: N-6 DNA methylase [unclassified Rhizobium]|uniref:N-6 DNA methylase n=1 Tax=unclassified Rhizobium TaxID=2613769 RepID=UPI0024795219|nr:MULTISPECIES: N-6 DNA methylase [unclassified Rhizobium]MDH7803765.1 hypothetical protein [Rhizobium sp. AN70]